MSESLQTSNSRFRRGLKLAALGAVESFLVATSIINQTETGVRSARKELVVWAGGLRHSLWQIAGNALDRATPSLSIASDYDPGEFGMGN